MIYEFGRWQVPVTSSKTHLEIIRAIYTHIKFHRQNFSYLRSSRFYSTESNDTNETWIYIDEYADRENYERMMKALSEDDRTGRLRKAWEALIVPGSFRTEVWTDFAHELWIA